jgi:filamentous hemagglutinin family protein
LVGGLITCRAIAFPALAEITLDGSLGSRRTIAGPTYLIPQIEGRAVGRNLFHSFGRFNLDSGETAVFESSGIRNIFARVTGSRSVIDGTIQADANLFLLNPRGILFGPNANLDIRGSFLATTANSIQFPNNIDFPAEALVPPLLSVRTPIGLQYGARSPGSIQVEGELVIDPGQSLVLAGGRVILDGGDLTVPGGHIELAGIQGEGLVELEIQGEIFELPFPLSDMIARADVVLTEDAVVDAAADGGGSIDINAQNLRMSDRSNILTGIASGTSRINQAGDIQIDATNRITLTGGSTIENSVRGGAIGTTGNIWITGDRIFLGGESAKLTSSGVYNRLERESAGRANSIYITASSLLHLRNGAVITASTRGIGNAGNVFITADRVWFDGKGRINPSGFNQSSAVFSSVTEFGNGNGGNVKIAARVLRLTNGGAVIAVTLGQGRAGNVLITADQVLIDGINPGSDFNSSGIYSRVEASGTDQGGTIWLRDVRELRLTNGGVILASTSGQGEAGSIIIERANHVILQGRETAIRANTEGQKDGGTIVIGTDYLSIRDGAQVSARTSGAGNAGSLDIEANESVLVDGTDSLLDFDTLSEVSNAGDAGDLTISTQRLFIQNGGRVSARSSGAGNAGTLGVRATDFVLIDGVGSGLTFDTTGSGDARGILVETGELQVQNQGEVTLSSGEDGTGNPGNLLVSADSIFLTNQGRLRAETNINTGGNIQLQVQDIVRMRFGSEISTSARGRGNGGSIDIDIPQGLVLAVLSENSDVVAGAIEGNGGRASTTAIGVFGFRQFIDRRTPESDFTAASELGIDGIVDIDTREREFEVELPDNFSEPGIAQNCQARNIPEQDEFVVTGRGGLPPGASELVEEDAVQVDLVTMDEGGNGRSEGDEGDESDEEGREDRGDGGDGVDERTQGVILEAQGWVMGDRGEVMLIAQAPATGEQLLFNPTVTCPARLEE